MQMPNLLGCSARLACLLVLVLTVGEYYLGLLLNASFLQCVDSITSRAGAHARPVGFLAGGSSRQGAVRALSTLPSEGEGE